MPIQVLMPALSPTMEKGNLSKWLKKEGETIKSGDVIAEIETDKATMEVEATDEGTLGKILIPEGTDDVAVNTPIATILADGESAADLGKATAPVKQEAKAAEPAAPAEAKAEAPASGGGEDKEGAGRSEGRRRTRSRSPRRHRDGDHDHPRSAARRHGRGNAPRPRRVRDGRGGRGISGRLQGDPGPAAGIRRQARDRHPDHRTRLCRHRRRRGDGRLEADRRVHDLQFRHAGDGPDHQFRGQDALYVGRPDGLLDRVPRPERRRRARRRPAQPGLFGLVLADPRPQGDRAVFGRRLQGPVEGRDPRSQSGDLPRKRNALRPLRRSAKTRRLRRSRSARRGSRAPAVTSPSCRGRTACPTR